MIEGKKQLYSYAILDSYIPSYVDIIYSVYLDVLLKTHFFPSYSFIFWLVVRIYIEDNKSVVLLFRFLSCYYYFNSFICECYAISDISRLEKNTTGKEKCSRDQNNFF